MFKKKEKSNTTEVVFKNYTFLRRSELIAEKVLELFDTKYKTYTDDQLKEKTLEFKKSIKDKKNSLEDILLDAFAVAMTAIHSTYGITLYKVQVMGAFSLHQGDVAEMKTGEGKTLTAILPAYLNSLSGNAVNIITVNEYLSQRDAFNTGKVFNKLGLTTGSVVAKMKPEEKKAEYAKDVVYSTNAEIGFDFLRDNMARTISQKVLKSFDYAIVDEVDSILIDEARTPLIIAGNQDATSEEYTKSNQFVQSLDESDYETDKEKRSAFLLTAGVKKAEEFYGITNLYSFQNSITVHRIHNALQANHVFTYDIDYTTKDGEVVLIDTFTGRLLPGRTLSEGLNQAIEAKEKLAIKPETKIIAQVTYQNLFRMFKKLSGMSGTAHSEEEEFLKIYNMRVLSIPTNVELNRKDLPDIIFRSQEAKNNAVIELILKIHETNQPILVGTRSVQDSEILSNILIEKNISHKVLNAKNNSAEADIIKAAGQLGAITISTNMAGRGTDIKLGEGVEELGGLFVIGTERNESRRVDNQLRGRSGRQGDIGSSQFFISLEDEILVRAGMAERLHKWLKSLDKAPIQSKSVTKSITSAQKKLEGSNFDQRKSVLEYDDVSNRQMLQIYKQRDSILSTLKAKKLLFKMIESYMGIIVNTKSLYQDEKFSSENVINYINNRFQFETPIKNLGELKDQTSAHIVAHFEKQFKDMYSSKDESKVEAYIKNAMLVSVDMNWQDHLNSLSKLKSTIHYRQFAQKNPVQGYIIETDQLFIALKSKILEQSIFIVFRNSINNKVNTVAQERKTKELIVG